MFREYYKEIYFDADNPIGLVYKVKQGDTQSRGLYVSLVKDRIVTSVTTETIIFYATKPDGKRVLIQGVKDDDRFRIDLTNQVFTSAGIVRCELLLSGANGEQVTSQLFKINVDSNIQEGALISKDERGSLDRAFELASDVIPRLEAIDINLMEGVSNTLDGVNQQIGDIQNDITSMTDVDIINILPESSNFNNLTSFSSRSWINPFIYSRYSSTSILKTVDGGNVIDGYYSDGDYNARMVFPVIANESYYIVAETKGSVSLQKREGVSIFNDVENESTDWVLTSVCFTASTSENISIRLGSSYLKYDSGYFRKIMLIKSSDIFGIGNEPSSIELDAIVSKIPNHWWTGNIDKTLLNKALLELSIKSGGDSVSKRGDVMTGSLSVPEVQMGTHSINSSNEEIDIVEIQRAGDDYTIFEIAAPDNNLYRQKESTLTLMRNRDFDTNKPEFLDLYNMNYTQVKQMGIRVQCRGEGGILRDFVFDFNDGSGEYEAVRIKPNKEVEFNGAIKLLGGDKQIVFKDDLNDKETIISVDANNSMDITTPHDITINGSKILTEHSEYIPKTMIAQDTPPDDCVFWVDTSGEI